MIGCRLFLRKSTDRPFLRMYKLTTKLNIPPRTWGGICASELSDGSQNDSESVVQYARKMHSAHDAGNFNYEDVFEASDAQKNIWIRCTNLWSSVSNKSSVHYIQDGAEISRQASCTPSTEPDDHLCGSTWIHSFLHTHLDCDRRQRNFGQLRILGQFSKEVNELIAVVF